MGTASREFFGSIHTMYTPTHNVHAATHRPDDGPGVVIGAAVRYRPPPAADAGPRVGDVGPLRPPLEPTAGKKRATSSMPVDKFLDKGGAALPRRDQGRKDREKNKRAKGQSSHSHWKSEAEMVLRQQYD